MWKRSLVLLWVAVVTLSATSGFFIDSLVQPLVGHNQPGLAILIRRAGHTVLERSYGVTDLDSLHPITSQTDFRLASCSKQFTAMSIMLLVHDGKLHYDEPLTDIFPSFPSYGRKITVRRMLTHTSGLPDYESLMGPQWTETNQINDGQVLTLLEQQTAGKFAPGTSWDYSNSAYVLLGLAVAKVSGKTFPQFLHDRIFAPLHMTSTLAYVKGQSDIPNRAFGYTTDQTGKLIPADQSATSGTLGDGGIYSNLADLAKWDDALRNHILLSAAEMSPAFIPVTLATGAQPTWPLQPGDDNLAPGKSVSYGFGWFLDPYKGRPRNWHFGTTCGFRTAIERFPGDGLTIIVLANRTDIDPATIALPIADYISSGAGAAPGAGKLRSIGDR